MCVQVRSEQFRFAAEALRTQKLKTYVPAFVQEAEVRQRCRAAVGVSHCGAAFWPGGRTVGLLGHG